MNITKDSFSALHVSITCVVHNNKGSPCFSHPQVLAGGHKKNKWMQELAGTKPLISLLRNDKVSNCHIGSVLDVLLYLILYYYIWFYNLACLK